MGEDIRGASVHQLDGVQRAHRDLIEHALRMRCLSYLAQVKARLLTETILDVDESKKRLAQVSDQASRQAAVIERQAETLAAANRELKERNTALEAASNFKSAFLAGVSHELRTPLNSIIGFTGVLLKKLAGPFNPEQERQLGMVRDSARHLLSLINDLLDLSRIEAGEMQVVHEACDVGAIVERVVMTQAPHARAKGLTLRASVAPKLSPIWSDCRRVEQILINLVANAIKFTVRGGVNVDCRMGDGELRLIVSDTGIGIDAEDHEAVFSAFRQVDGAAHRYGGSGLGLSISRALAEVLGGSIRVESRTGGGSRFIVTLPAGGGGGA